MHLPSEIWLQIASYCDPKILWLGLRPVNRQIKACVEQQFHEIYFSHATLVLKGRIPTYDMRNPLESKVTFFPQEDKGATAEPGEHRQSTFVLSHTKPIHYKAHFLSRWKGMAESGQGRLTNAMIDWTMTIGDWQGAVRLRDPVALYQDVRDDEADIEDEDGVALLQFEWMSTTTRFFRRSEKI